MITEAMRPKLGALAMVATLHTFIKTFIFEVIVNEPKNGLLRKAQSCAVLRLSLRVKRIEKRQTVYDTACRLCGG